MLVGVRQFFFSVVKIGVLLHWKLTNSSWNWIYLSSLIHHFYEAESLQISGVLQNQISLPKMVYSFSFIQKFSKSGEKVQEIMKLYSAPIWYHPPYIYLIQGPFILVRHACTSTIQFGGTTQVWVKKNKYLPSKTFPNVYVKVAEDLKHLCFFL